MGSSSYFFFCGVRFDPSYCNAPVALFNDVQLLPYHGPPVGVNVLGANAVDVSKSQSLNFSEDCPCRRLHALSHDTVPDAEPTRCKGMIVLCAKNMYWHRSMHCILWQQNDNRNSVFVGRFIISTYGALVSGPAELVFPLAVTGCASSRN